MKHKSKLVAASNSSSDAVNSDERFTRVLWDPKFNRIPRRERKVVVDSRFQAMFNEPNFALSYKVDKRGRLISKHTSEDLRRYYDLPSSESGSESEDDSTQQASTSKKERKLSEKARNLEKKNIKSANEIVMPKSSVKSSSDTDNEAASSEHVEGDSKQENVVIDLARGEGNLESSDDDSESEWQLTEAESAEIDWGELDKDAPKVDDDELTHRLAVCNQDWDRIKAKDLLILFTSFLPGGSTIRSVTIYPSDFGAQRMETELLHGPVELAAQQGSDDEDDMDEKEKKSITRERLRLHQLNRLKYYYAVVECDSKETANALYTACDGIEYETSGCRLDLRFIPDDTQFDKPPRETVTDSEDLVNYKPTMFVNTALQQSKVEVTWDETDFERQRRIQSAFCSENISDSELCNYVASSDSSGSEDESEQVSGEGNTKNPLAQKYRALLDTLDDSYQNPFARPKSTRTADDEILQMEVSWESGFRDTEQHTSSADEVVESLVPRKNAKQRRRKDNNVPNGVGKTKKGLKRQKLLRSDTNEHHTTDLALLVDDTQSGRSHFSLNKLLEVEKPEKQRKELNQYFKTVSDGFEIDLHDQRFNAVFDSHDYNIDPTDSQFKKTAGMKLILGEKLRRQEVPNASHKEINTSETHDDTDGVLRLADKLRRKATTWQAKRRKASS